MLRTDTQVGVLLVGHGTQEARGRQGFIELAGLVQAMMPQEPVELGFLEMARPNIRGAVQRLAARGARRLAVVPGFLAAGAHVRRDIPAAVGEAVRAHPGMAARQLPHLGCHHKLVELSARRFEEALISRGNIPRDKTMLLLVGRGSRDRRAIAEMFHFARRRRPTASVGWLKTCFWAMASPRLPEAVAEAGWLPIRRVVVQPHLLMPGELARRIGRAVERFARREHSLVGRGARGIGSPERAQIEWLVTEPLGPDPLLAEAVLEILWASGFAGGASRPPRPEPAEPVGRKIG